MLEQIEIIGIIMIVLLQGYISYTTYLRINDLSAVLNTVDLYSIIKVKIPVNDIETIHPKQILAQLNTYIYKGNNDEYIDGQSTEINIVYSNEDNSGELKNILDAVNTYLIRNRSAVSDFNLIKDIVERTGDKVEEEINSTISVPLYLGLLGTLAGIIIGLFNISDLDKLNEAGSVDLLSNAIPELLGGVKTAMFASFFGLAFTVMNSGWFYRIAKSKFEKNKNDFYSFIQVELMPVLNQSINSSLASLQTNLHKFNENFTHNIATLGGLMSKNHDAIIAQDNILTKLDSIDIADFVKANVKVLSELRKSTDSFAVFNQYVTHINDALQSTTQIVERMDSLLKRTENMDKVSEKILTTFDDNRTLMDFLQSHYSTLDESKQMLSDSVIGVGDILDKALQQLQQFTQEKIVKMQEVMIREINLLEHEYPEKWKKLDNLEDIKNHTAQIKQNTREKKSDLENEIVEVKDRLKSIDETLICISNKKPWYSIFKKIRIR
jgi:hypothetical protein